MGLLFTDSFDHYTSLDQKYEFVSNPGGDGATEIVSSIGSESSSALRTRRATGAGAHFVRKFIIPHITTVIVGFNFKIGDSLAGTNFFQIGDSNGSTIHITLTHDSSGAIQVRRGGNGGTVLGTSTATLDTTGAGDLVYVELKITINDSTGVVQLRMDGNLEVDLTSQDTSEGGNSEVGFLSFGCSTSTNSYQWIYDDIYVLDTTGSFNNDFIGPVRIQSVFPTANGGTNDFTALSGSNYQNVDEVAPDDDTTYVHSSTVNDQDLYDYTAPASVDILGVNVLVRSRKDDAGLRSISTLAKSGATVSNGATTPTTETYRYINTPIDQKLGGGAWTVSAFDATEFGVEIET